ncbi:MAG: hypothetical protein ACXAEX_21590 [Promethearchaeota archaeon]
MANTQLISNFVTPTRFAPASFAAFLSLEVISVGSVTSNFSLYHSVPIRLGPNGFFWRSQLNASVYASWTVQDASDNA